MPESLIQVTVVMSPGARQVREVALEARQGTTVEQALDASGLAAGWRAPGAQPLSVGVWGRAAPLDQPLRDHDRVEIYRPLIVDPKVARRERFQKQGARSAGLFAKKRAGAKAGY